MKDRSSLQGQLRSRKLVLTKYADQTLHGCSDLFATFECINEAL